MDCAPLNLAHFHERRAEKLLKRHHYEEAYKAVETSVLYVQDAYKIVRIPKALEVLNTQVWDYQRKLQQIKMRQQQYERLKSKEIVPPAAVQQNENNASTKATDLVSAQSIARSIDKTVKDFNDKYGSSSLVTNVERLNIQESEIMPASLLNELSPACTATESNEPIETADKNKSNVLEEHLQAYDDLPSLAPLELPSFDFTAFMSSGIVENFQK